MTLENLARTSQGPALDPARESDLMARLKTGTAALHEEAQAHVPLLSPGLTLETYAAHLRRLYGFYLPLEPRLRDAARLTSPSEATDPFQLSRRAIKSDWLRADLLALGDTSEVIAALPVDPTCWRLEEFTDLVGTLYVLEGSTLGAQIVRRLLKTRLQLPEERMHFYSGYGRDTGAMWNAFRSTARSLIRPNEIPRAVEAAQRTFQQIIEWLRLAPTGPRA